MAVEQKQIDLWWSHLSSAKKCVLASEVFHDNITSPKEATRIFCEVCSEDLRVEIYTRETNADIPNKWIEQYICRKDTSAGSMTQLWLVEGDKETVKICRKAFKNDFAVGDKYFACVPKDGHGGGFFYDVILHDKAVRRIKMLVQAVDMAEVNMIYKLLLQRSLIPAGFALSSVSVTDITSVVLGHNTVSEDGVKDIGGSSYSAKIPGKRMDTEPGSIDYITFHTAAYEYVEVMAGEFKETT